MFKTTISAAEVAKALRISENGVLELAKENGFDIVDGGLSVSKAAEFMQKVEQDDGLSRLRAAEFLTRAVQRYVIIVDTCTLLNDAFLNLYRRLTPLLNAEGKKLVIPTSVTAELKHLLITRPDLRSKIANVFAFLEEEYVAEMIEFQGDETEVFGDQQILSLASKLFLTSDVMLLTYDKNLARDALNLKNLGSIKGHDISVNRVSKHGFISRLLPKTHEPARGYRTATAYVMP